MKLRLWVSLGLGLLPGVWAFAAEAGVNEFMVTAGYGLSGSAYTSLDGENLGEMAFDDSNLFGASSEPDFVYSWNLGVVYSHYLTSNASFDLGLTYSYQPFSVRYPGESSPYDLVFRSEYQLLKVPVLLTGHWGWFTLGAGVSYQAILANDSTVSLGSESAETALKDSENSLSIVVQPGFAFSLGEPSLRFFLRWDQNVSEIYSAPYWITDVSLIDISANLGMAIAF